MNSQRLPSSSVASLRWWDEGEHQGIMDSSQKCPEQTGVSLVPRPSWGSVAVAQGPEGRSYLTGRSRERDGDHPSRGVACPGGALVTPRHAHGRPGDAGAGRAPRVARRSPVQTRAPPQYLRPRRAGAPRLIGGSRKLETCQQHSPATCDVLAGPRRP